MASDAGFRMTVTDVFSIRGRGTVVTGRIEAGTLRAGDTVRITGQLGSRSTIVTAIETFRKQVEQAAAGENVGLLLEGVAKSEMRPGDLIVGEASY